MVGLKNALEGIHRLVARAMSVRILKQDIEVTLPWIDNRDDG